MMYEYTTHELYVEGHLWMGGHASYEYTLKRDDTPPVTLADAKRYAGDFESLTSAKIIISKHTVDTTEKELT